MSRVLLSKLMLPGQMQREVASREKARRRRMGYTQEQLAAKSEVSVGSLRRFEQTGQISFSSLVSISYALGCSDELTHLFAMPGYHSIDEVINEAHSS